jgi:hypothetical protein
MQINRIIEYTSSEYVRTSFFPETTPDDWVQHETWMKPHAMDAATGNLTLIMQAFLVRTRLGKCHSETTPLVYRPCLFTGHQLCLHPGKIVPGQGKFGMETEGLFKSRNGLLIQTEFS